MFPLLSPRFSSLVSRTPDWTTILLTRSTWTYATPSSRGTSSRVCNHGNTNKHALIVEVLYSSLQTNRWCVVEGGLTPFLTLTQATAYLCLVYDNSSANCCRIYAQTKGCCHCSCCCCCCLHVFCCCLLSCFQTQPTSSWCQIWTGPRATPNTSSLEPMWT